MKLCTPVRCHDQPLAEPDAGALDFISDGEARSLCALVRYVEPHMASGHCLFSLARVSSSGCSRAHLSASSVPRPGCSLCQSVMTSVAS
jgi:hypothetical protein